MGKILISLVLISCISKGNNGNKDFNRKLADEKTHKIIVNNQEIEVKEARSSLSFKNFVNIEVPKDKELRVFIKDKEIKNKKVINKNSTLRIENIKSNEKRFIDIIIEDEFSNFKKNIFEISSGKKGLKLTPILDEELKKKLAENFEYISIEMNNQNLKYLNIDFNEKEIIVENSNLDLGLNKLSIFLVKKYTSKKIEIQSYEHEKKFRAHEGSSSPFKSIRKPIVIKGADKRTEELCRSLEADFKEVDDKKEVKIDFKLKVFSKENENGYIWDLESDEGTVDSTIEISLREEDKENYKLFVNNQEVKDKVRVIEKSIIKLTHLLSNTSKEKNIEVKRENLDLNNIFIFDSKDLKLNLKSISNELKEHLTKRFHKLTLKLENQQRTKDASEYFENCSEINIGKIFQNSLKEKNILIISLSEFFEDIKTTLEMKIEFEEEFNINIENHIYNLKNLKETFFRKNLKISLEDKKDKLVINGSEVVNEGIIKNSSIISIKRDNKEIKQTLRISKLEIDAFKLKNIVDFVENDLILNLSIDKEDINNFEQFENIVLLINNIKRIVPLENFRDLSINLEEAPYNINMLDKNIEIKAFLQEFYSDDKQEVQTLEIKREQIENFNLKKKQEKERAFKIEILQKLDNNREALLNLINNPDNIQFVKELRFDNNKNLAHLICESKFSDLIISCEVLRSLINEKDEKGRTPLYYLSMEESKFYIWENHNLTSLNYDSEDENGKKILDLAAEKASNKIFEFLLNKTTVENAEDLFRKILETENIMKLRALVSKGLKAELSEYYWNDNENFLHKFLKENKIELAKSLLENKIVKISSLSQDNKNVLHVAACNFSKDLKTLFENYKEDLKVLVNKNLYEIVESGQRIISPKNNLVPLYYAIEAHNKEAVDYLLELEANVNIYFIDIHSLVFATQKALEKDDLTIVFKLAENMISRGDKEDLEYNFSFLQYASLLLSKECKLKKYNIVLTDIAEAGNKKLFIQALNFAKKNNLRIEFYFPKTILHYSIDFNMKELFDEFLNKGSYYGCKLINYEESSEGQEVVSIAIYALKNKKFEFLKDIIKNENFKFRSEEDEDAYFYPFNSSFLHELAKIKQFDANYKEIFEICIKDLKHKINQADFQDDNGKSPLIYFIENGNIEAVKALLSLDNPFSLRYIDKSKRNIFHYVCMLNYEDINEFKKIVKEIIIEAWRKEKGVLELKKDFKAKEEFSRLYSSLDEDGNTPTDLLKDEKYKKVFALLFMNESTLSTPQKKKYK